MTCQDTTRKKKTMDVCFITPTPMLKEVAVLSKRHLVLAHQYLEDPCYADFYKERKLQGDIILLDNSAYELGASMSAGILKDIARELHPDYIFLPDVRFDKNATLKAVREAIPILQGLGAKLLAVPQGSNQEEILECYAELVLESIDGFGLYEEIGQVAGLKNRAEFLQLLEDKNLVVQHMYYHLLGMEEDVSQLRALAQFDWTDSVDSVKPIAYGLYGVKFHPEDGALTSYPHRQRNYFAYTGAPFMDIVIYNCSRAIYWAQK